MELNDETIRGARVAVPGHVAQRAFAAETVALNLKTGRYHGLNGTAARMLSELAQGDTVADTAVRLADALGERRELVERDIVELCRSLAERGLIELHGRGGR